MLFDFLSRSTRQTTKMIKRENKICAIFTYIFNVALVSAILIGLTIYLITARNEKIQVKNSFRVNNELSINSSDETFTISSENQKIDLQTANNSKIYLIKHKNFHLFNKKNCGTQKVSLKFNRRVMMGELTRFIENPWMAALFYNYKNGTILVQCAGSLVSGNIFFQF